MSRASQRETLSISLFMYWGKQVNQWPSKTIQNCIADRKPLLPLPQFKLNKYPFSDQKATLNNMISDILRLAWSKNCTSPAIRYDLVRRFFREGSTRSQRIFLSSMLLFYEILVPLLLFFLLILAILVRLALQLGVRSPLLRWINLTVSGNALHGNETLPPGENGYTKVFQGGSEVSLDKLEEEFMTRNTDSDHDHTNCHVTTICISYKHYANFGVVHGDDHRICRTDLQAIANLIKASAPCKLKFWIDTKLPPTLDSSFERWLNRGVRPYGRYITFICPSAQQYAQSSFWLANEYHFASAAKGVMYIEHDQIFYELRYGYNLDLHLRLLRVIIEAERHPVQVRQEDRAKVINWAMCCLWTEQRGLQSLSPIIDNMAVAGEDSDYFTMMRKIDVVIRKFGPQELPVPPGRSWNRTNPLLVYDSHHQQLDHSCWYGMSLDESPQIVHFIYNVQIFGISYDTVVVLEVTLDRPHFNPGRIRVIRKVLKELSSSVIMRCKFVALPWLCNWE